MRLFRRSLAAFFVLILLTGAALAQDTPNALFQYSTLDALLEGVYEGQLTIGELLKKGDLGLGTFNELDGEMVVLDGTAYQVRYSGKVERVPAEAKTPFAQVVPFQADQTIRLAGPVDFGGLKKAVEAALPSPNLFYAVRISGRFEHVKARSVPRQSRPFPRLAEVVKHQAVFEFNDTSGDIVGFISPAYVKGLGAPGWHLHFLRADRQAGGHVLALNLRDVEVRIDHIAAMDLALPTSGDFLGVGLAHDKSADLKKVEGSH